MMKQSRILLAAVVAVSAFAANAAVGTHGEVGGTPQAAQAKGYQRPSWATKNVWSTSYNPLIGWQGEKTRAQVQDELMQNRQALLAHEGQGMGGGRHFALFGHRRANS